MRSSVSSSGGTGHIDERPEGLDVHQFTIGRQPWSSTSTVQEGSAGSPQARAVECFRWSSILSTARATAPAELVR